MTQVNAGITTSVDGYIVGPNDGPGRGHLAHLTASSLGSHQREKRQAGPPIPSAG
jgi:hypothetical protein